MHLENIRCSICSSDNSQEIFNIGNGYQHITNVICNVCGLVYINPRPLMNELMKWQVASEQGSGHHSTDTLDKARVKVEGSDRLIKEKVAEWLMPFIKLNLQQIPNFKILDIGCGYGTLLQILKEKINRPEVGYEGIEMSEKDIYYARELFGLEFSQKIFHGTLEEFRYKTLREIGSGIYDLIILHHTFEHFADPSRELAYIKELLKPNTGILYIAVPNILNMKKRPEIFFQLSHPFSYSPASLKKMLWGNGILRFKITDFNWNAAYPGGMECIAKQDSVLIKELQGPELDRGRNPAEVVAYVQKKAREFNLWRRLRDSILFLFPEKLRIAIGRPFYLFMKKRK